ncbi:MULTISPECIES: hypothetical protein [Corynebacterium]|uniref:hypothetical protein n=1 Tax=Corynebacterium TaxID=1716 RepID=UPI0008A15C0E|nr:MULTISPECIES: hypothetical protein [Corynebacterium]MCT1443297.1 hypothetical protein [Corynebacterium glucuronolyticum]MCT1563118.1 hypothetical protein [Corynebacterium glucuronolyticum]OFO42642.1 hypothetical protein HMPREF3044_05525 [Corynebacterium sp. HMSC073D01]
MSTLTRSLVAATTAATVSLGSVVATAEDTSSVEPAPETATRDAFGGGWTGNQAYGYEIGRLIGHMHKDGYGAMPDTYEAGRMAGGSVTDLGMTGDEASPPPRPAGASSLSLASAASTTQPRAQALSNKAKRGSSNELPLFDEQYKSHSKTRQTHARCRHHHQIVSPEKAISAFSLPVTSKSYKL